jgi:anti-sigma regulatory factor (Ser/Thr protein kinase)
MTASMISEERWAEAFQHEALFYAGIDDFLAGTLPFLRDGLEHGEPMLVAVPGSRVRALKAELGESANSIAFFDMEVIGRNPAHIIPAWSEFLAANGGGARAVRGIGEPIWAGRSDSELVECQRHESLLNVAFAHSGSWRLLCPYDTVGLPADVIAEAERSHPWVSHCEAGRCESTRCRDLDAMSAPFDVPLPEPPPHAMTLAFGLDDIPAVRGLIAKLSAEAGLDQNRADDFVLATHEILTNSVRHAGGRGTVRTWSDARGVFCDVIDTGKIERPLVGRERPRDDQPGGRGVWMANQLCDLVQIRTFAEGNVVRLHIRRAT